MTDDDKLYQSRPGRTYQPRPKKAPLESETKQLKELAFKIRSIRGAIYSARTECEFDDMMDRLDRIEDDLEQISDDIIDITYDIERES